VLERAPKTVEFGDDELVAAPRDHEGLVEFGGRASLPEALSMKIRSHPVARRASSWASGF
jgi:hypothetical protein